MIRKQNTCDQFEAFFFSTEPLQDVVINVYNKSNRKTYKAQQTYQHRQTANYAPVPSISQFTLGGIFLNNPYQE